MDNAGSQVTSTSSIEDLGHPGHLNSGGKPHAVVSSSDALLAPLYNIVVFTPDDACKLSGRIGVYPLPRRTTWQVKLSPNTKSSKHLVPATHPIIALCNPFFPAVETFLWSNFRACHLKSSVLLVHQARYRNTFR